MSALGGLLLFAVIPVFLLAVVLSVRVLFLVVILMLPLALLVLAMSSRARAWVGDAEANLAQRLSGIRLPAGLLVHPHHSWVREGDQGEATLGADDLLLRTLGPVEGLSLPAVGERVRRGGPLFTLRRGDRSLVVRAPISGTVSATNPWLPAEPALINRSPYGAGWAVTVRPTDLAGDRRHLREGGEIEPWYRGEVDDLVMCAAGASDPTLNDGGTLVDDLHEQISDTAWERIRCLFFGHVEES